MQTLLQKTGLLATKWSKPQEELDKYPPLQYIMDFIKTRLKKTDSPANRLLVLKAATGSGKSAILPPELYHVFFEDMQRGIASLQPLVFLAIDLPTTSIIPFHTKEFLKKTGKPGRVPLELGENIGFQTGVVSNQPVKGLTYMTVGVLSQQMNIMSDKEFMKKYGFIIIDEAHKRSIATDTVMFKLKKFIERNYKNPECPFIIITSATFDPVHLCDYMLSSVKKPDRYQNIIEIKGFTAYPITEKFLDYDARDVLQAVVDTVAQVHKEYAADFLGVESITKKRKKTMLEEDAEEQAQSSTYYRDILIFVAGASDIRKIKAGIDKLNAEDEFFKKHPVLPLELTGEIVSRKALDYTYIVDRDIEDLSVEVRSAGSVQIKKPTRRVIIATNVGEVGVTYKALKHVIDMGFHKSAEHNPMFGSDALILKPITQGIHTQRKGRVGRRAPGYSFPMFTEKSYNSMLEDELPDILLKDMTLNVLGLLIQEIDPENTSNELEPYQMFSTEPNFMVDMKYELKNARKDLVDISKSTKINITKIDMPDLPSADSLHEALEKLYMLGAIDSNVVPTAVGFLMNKFRKMSAESVRMILAGYAWDAPIADLVTIAAFMNHATYLYPRALEKNREAAIARNMVGATRLSGNASKQVPGYSALYGSLMIADEFINNVILYYEFQKKVEEQINAAKIEDLSSLEEWCTQRGISFGTLVKAIKDREEIIQTLAIIGFNPYQNDDKALRHILDCYQNCSRNDLYKYVCNIKQCIYEGYKMNIAEWNPRVKAYIGRANHMNLPITSELVAERKTIMREGDSNPKFIIYDAIFMRLNPMTGVYVPSVSAISVLDGFVAIDTNFDK